ncbi:cellulose synthase operon protein YhjQ/BcsQ [Edaphobacter bradus]|uniref:cellulose synthase operon protein YhjQ/BcsQ n=1 Tax=Edaphobacter bradus TaxID=2259016 RepID=UPI0021E060AE|nr:cellulose synthase operon protein YhjQ/BcsQ [Edaphobacter bradus]
MEPRWKDKTEERGTTETPEDVAVLYSWANLHGAKYRDFSASRREYRAQLRHRAAEQEREQALQAQAEAEAAAAEADEAARKAAEVAHSQQTKTDSGVRRALREAEQAARMAAAERVEAARRAEAAAEAEAAARREEREIAEAHASAQRQAARYAESEIRRRELAARQAQAPVPGRISDPYTPKASSQQSNPQTTASSAEMKSPTESQSQSDPQAPLPAAKGSPAPPPPPLIQRTEPGVHTARHTQSSAEVVSGPIQHDSGASLSQQISLKRRQGYHPDEASGVREIYRGPEHPTPQPIHQAIPPLPRGVASSELPSSADQPVYGGKRHTDPQPPLGRIRQVPTDPDIPSPVRTEGWQTASGNRAVPNPAAEFESNIYSNLGGQRPIAGAPAPQPGSQQSGSPRPLPPVGQVPMRSDSTRGRRAQDSFIAQPANSYAEPPRRIMSEEAHESSASSSRAPYVADPAGPAWLYAPPPAPEVPQRSIIPPPQVQSSVAETLQHSRERVAARWYALKGVFEQPGQDSVEAPPVRQKEIRTPVLAVFSLAGGVGKTSLVATVGRSLSSLGEKVLLTDTTSQGLLPFYFGASELRPGTVRTFSPPSGSTDAPIYLVSYDVEEKSQIEEAQQQLVEEILNSSRGTHRILLDLTVSSGWVVRHMARMSPTILVPLGPDMNSVITLQTIEKFFNGMIDGDGRPLEPYYVLNQFDASLPLHLDVREVLRRQLGDRLLPFVIHRAPVVSEALAEGMTVVDYSPDSAVSEDYMNVATWLRTIAAPAAAGFRNVRWSER